MNLLIDIKICDMDFCNEIVITETPLLTHSGTPKYYCNDCVRLFNNTIVKHRHGHTQIRLTEYKDEAIN